MILMDLSMPRMNGMDALPEIKRLDPEVPVIICTAHADLATAVRAMKLGAYDYLTKPFDLELLALTLERAVERNQLRSRIDELKRQGQGSSLSERMGGSPAIAQVIRQVGQVAESSFTVLVQGETGTGKELVARAIHQQSPRRQAPFVAVDCGAIPETLVESELFGHERGAFTGAQSQAGGPLPAREGRHPVPRRDRQHPGGDPGEAAPGAGAARSPAARKRPRRWRWTSASSRPPTRS